MDILNVTVGNDSKSRLPQPETQLAVFTGLDARIEASNIPKGGFLDEHIAGGQEIYLGNRTQMHVEPMLFYPAGGRVEGVAASGRGDSRVVEMA